MKTSLFSRICNKPLPWYLYLASFVAFCAAEVLIKNALYISLGVIPVVILFLICLFATKAVYYALTAPVPPPITPSVPADSEIAEIDVPASAPAKRKPTTAIILLLCLCVLSGGICYYIGLTMSSGYEDGYDDGFQAGLESGKNQSPSSQNSLHTDEYGYIPMIPPENGQIFLKPDNCVAPFTIETSESDSSYYYVKLKDSDSQQSVIEFFVHGGQTVDIDVPLGTYELYYACGSSWYGDSVQFGPTSTFYKANDIFDFTFDGYYYNGWTISLYSVPNGSLDTEEIDASEF